MQRVRGPFLLGAVRVPVKPLPFRCVKALLRRELAFVVEDQAATAIRRRVAQHAHSSRWAARSARSWVRCKTPAFAANAATAARSLLN